MSCKYLIDTIIIEVAKIEINGLNAIFLLKKELSNDNKIGYIIIYSNPVFDGF